MNEKDPGTEFALLESHDERLSQVSEPVPHGEIGSPEIQGIIGTMLQVASGERDAGPGGAYMVGLAAPQLGIMKRIVIVDMSIRHDQLPGTSAPKSQLTAFINPEITEHSSETYEFREGCFSFHAKDGIYAKVPRNKSIRVRAYTKDSQLVEFEAEGYTARILQHEIDHLDGMRYPDRLPKGRGVHKVEPSELPTYRDGGWQNWPNEIPATELT